jgi:hypothetical protein
MKTSWLFLLLSFLTAVCPWLAPYVDLDATSHTHGQEAFPGWPDSWEGASLRALPLSEREKQFEKDFPGRLGHFTDGHRQFVIRWVSSLTRKLHPASDCFRGAGYMVRPAAIHVDEQARHWGCFDATRGEESLNVCELLFDDGGRSWPDVSSWYWASVLGGSDGPWWAVTIVEKAEKAPSSFPQGEFNGAK